MCKDILKIKGGRCYVTLHITPDALSDKTIRYWAYLINGKDKKTGVSKVFAALSKVVGYGYSNTRFRLEHYASMHPSITVFDNEVTFVIRSGDDEFRINRCIGRFERFTDEEISEIKNFMVKYK